MGLACRKERRGEKRRETEGEKTIERYLVAGLGLEVQHTHTHTHRATERLGGTFGAHQRSAWQRISASVGGIASRKASSSSLSSDARDRGTRAVFVGNLVVAMTVRRRHSLGNRADGFPRRGISGTEAGTCV